ncbi:MAG: hypothetical protein M1609_02025 [Firmicutes bacterium]|nr:hypothetical protein [Bacillota bacterium]
MITGRGKARWLDMEPRQEDLAGKEKKTPAEGNLNKNPFLADPIEEEINRYTRSLRRVK